MKKLLLLLLIAPVIFISCGQRQNKKNQKSLYEVVEFSAPSITVPENYTQLPNNSDDIIYELEKKIDGILVADFVVSVENDSVFKLVTNKQYIERAASDVESWESQFKDMNYFELIESVIVEFNNIGPVVKRSQKYIEDSESNILIYGDVYQFIKNGYLYTCTGRTKNIEEHSEDFVEIMKSIKFD